jgi:hypothetical protein
MQFIEREELIIKDEVPDFNDDYYGNEIENDFDVEPVDDPSIGLEDGNDPPLANEDTSRQTEVTAFISNELEAEIVNEVFNTDGDVIYSQEEVVSTNQDEGGNEAADNEDGDEGRIYLPSPDLFEDQERSDFNSTFSDHCYNKEQKENDHQMAEKDLEKNPQLSQILIEKIHAKITERKNEEITIEELQEIQRDVFGEYNEQGMYYT